MPLFVAAFIFVAIIMAIIKKLCANFIKSVGLGGLNYLLGAVFGVVRGILICAILIIGIEMLNLDPSHAWQKSRLYNIINPVVEWVADAIHREIKELPKPPQLVPNY